MEKLRYLWRKGSCSPWTQLLFGLYLCSTAAQGLPILTWRAAVTESAKNNADLKLASEYVQAARSSVSASRASYMPTVSANFVSTLAADQGRSFNPGKAEDSYSASITASETIFDGFQTRSLVEQSSAQLRQTELKLESLKAGISFDLKSAYSGMLLAQKTLRLYQDILRRRQDNLRLVELRFVSGRENKGAVLLSEAYLKQAKYEELQARNSLAVTRSKLNKVLGRGDDSSYELHDEVPSTPAPGIVEFSILVRNSPDYRLAIAQQDEATARLALTRAGFYPSLGLRGSVGRQGQDFFPQNDQWSISMTLTIPLFSGGSDYYAKQAAISKLSAAGLNRESNERELLVKIRQAHNGFLEAIEKLKLDESFEDAVTLRAEIARSKYNNGLTSFDDWDLIENDLISRQRSVLATQRDRVMAEATWEQSQGRGVLP